MKNILKIFPVVVLAAWFSSCTKDVLNKPPLNSITDAAVWNDLGLAEAYADNLYNILPNILHNWDAKSSRTWALSVACDEGYNKFDDYNEAVLNKGTLSPDNMGNFDIWAMEFNNIQQCNIFLSKIDGVPGDAATRNRLKGEVYYLRAYAYFMLIRDYGGVPIFSKPFDLNSDFTNATRSSFDSCVAFITANCDSAASLLPVTYGTSDANFGRATGGAAMALKSTILLYDASPLWNPSNDLGKWQKASDAALAVINTGAYHLYDQTPYDQMFVTLNPELIMVSLTNGKYIDDNTFYKPETFLSPNGFHGWSSFAPSQQLVDAFNMANGKLITDPTSGYNPQDPYVNRDPRFYNDILFDGRPFGNPAYCQDRYAAGGSNVCEFYAGGLDSQNGFDSWNYSLTGYSFRKYQDTTYNHNTAIAPNKFWIISRLSEIYLNYAEAQYHLGHPAVAIQYLNMIRQRPGVNLPPLDPTLSGTALLQRIQNERQVELCLEGHRYYDVRRWKIADVTQDAGCGGVHITLNNDGTKTYSYTTIETRSFNSPANYLLPIPRTEIQRTHLQQNPGYQ